MRDSFTEAQLRCSAGTPISLVAEPRAEVRWEQPLRIPYSVPPSPILGFHSVFCGGAPPARTTSSSRVRPGCGQGMVDWTDWPHRPGPAASWPVLRRREFRGLVSTGRPVVPWSARSPPPRPSRCLRSAGRATPPSVRPSAPPRCGPWLCSLPVTAQLHCNQPQPGSSETQILHKSRQRAAPPVALVHIWRLNPSTGGDAGAGGTPRRTRCCHLDPRQRLSGLRWTCPRGEGVCGWQVWYRAGEVYPSSDAEQYRGSGEAEVRSLPCTDQ